MADTATTPSTPVLTEAEKRPEEMQVKREAGTVDEEGNPRTRGPMASAAGAVSAGPLPGADAGVDVGGGRRGGSAARTSTAKAAAKGTSKGATAKRKR